MSAGQRSIGQRLVKAKSLQAKRAAAQSWAAEWQVEQAALITAIAQAIRSSDGARTASALASMGDMHAKRFAALPGVLDALLAYEADDSHGNAPDI